VTREWFEESVRGWVRCARSWAWSMRLARENGSWIEYGRAAVKRAYCMDIARRRRRGDIGL